MSDIQGAAPPTEAPGLNQATETVPVDAGTERYSAREAANALESYRTKRDAPEAAPPTEEAAPAPAREPTAEAQPTEELQPADEATIEAPRSWSREEKERFASFPRETQEYLARRENERDTALRRGQNDVAAQRQQFETQRAQVDAMRQQYENLLPQMQAALQEQQMGQFGDIRTQADVERMAREDWPRFALWQAHRMKMDAVNQEVQATYQRQQQEYTQKWGEFAKAEDGRFAEQAPEMANPAEAQKITQSAVTALRDVGFSDDDLNKLWSGQASVSLRDHRIQLIIRDAARYRDAKAGAPTRKAALPASKTLRPGTPAERATEAQQSLDNLSKRLDSHDSGLKGVMNATELLLARRAARR